jgi:hypothetical protein
MSYFVEKNFPMISKQLSQALDNGAMTIGEWMLLMWIYEHSTPSSNTYFGYDELAQVFKPYIRLDEIKKIMRRLRSHRYIEYDDVLQAYKGKFRVHVRNLKF